MLFFKKKQKTFDQIVYEVIYKVLCPICKKEIIDEKRIYTLPVTSKILMECEKCHIAIYAHQTNIKTIKNTYIESTSPEALCGFKLMKTKEI